MRVAPLGLDPRQDDRQLRLLGRERQAFGEDPLGVGGSAGADPLDGQRATCRRVAAVVLQGSGERRLGIAGASPLVQLDATAVLGLGPIGGSERRRALFGCTGSETIAGCRSREAIATSTGRVSAPDAAVAVNGTRAPDSAVSPAG